MTALSIQPPFPIFTDTDGSPLENGYIWLGTANQDPQANPIAAYWDAALTITAAQPIRTSGGYPSRSGTPARLYVGSDYSILVQNKNGSTLYSAPEATEAYGGGIINASVVVYDPAGSGAVPTTVQAKLRETVSVKDFGAVPGQYIDDALDAAIAAINDGGTIVLSNGTDLPYKIGRTHILNKYLTFKGDGAAAFYSGGVFDYNSMVSIIVDDGVTAFLSGRDVINNPTAILPPYGGGMLIFDGVQARPQTLRSANSCLLRYNSRNTLQVRNCIIRGFAAGLDLTGCFGCDVHDNYFTENTRAINGDPDFTGSTQDPDGSIAAGWENNDWRIYSNTFIGSTDAHIFTNMQGHGISVYNNSMEGSPIGVKVSGYDGAKIAPVYAHYGFSEYDNYYEACQRPVIVGSSNTNSVVIVANVGGSYINTGDASAYPYLTVKAVQKLAYGSGSMFQLSAFEATYRELDFSQAVVNDPLVLGDLTIYYGYTGTFKPVVELGQNNIEMMFRRSALGPLTVYVNGNDANAVTSVATNANGTLKITDFDAGKSSMPFKTLDDLTFWLLRTPLGQMARKDATSIQINLSGSFAAGAFNGKGIAGQVVVKTIDTSDAATTFESTSEFQDCTNLLFDGCTFKKTDPATANFNGFVYLRRSTVFMRNTNFQMSGGDAAGGSTWIATSSTKLIPETSTTITTTGGKNRYFVRLQQGSIVFTTTSITASEVVDAVTLINSGSAALVV